jgi:Zn-dependent peptidase ImmA (M78 family)
LWRAKPADSELVQADFLRRCERHGRLLKLLGREAAGRLPSFPVDLRRMKYVDADERAGEVGLYLNLGRRPAAVLEDAIQDQYDVLVWYRDDNDGGSAACCRGDFGSAILLPRSSVPWRRNFDIAHELFHLLTWDSFNPTIDSDEDMRVRADRMAEEFAAALLMPETVLRREINSRAVNGEVQVVDVVPLAADLDVSLKALMYRLLNLGYLPSKAAVEQLSDDERLQRIVRELRQQRRQAVPSLPSHFVTMAYAAWARGRLSKLKLAEYLETTLAGLPSRLAEFGIAGPDEAAADSSPLLDMPVSDIDAAPADFGDDTSLRPA